MMNKHEVGQGAKPNQHYLLQPVDAKAKLIMNKNPYDFTVPPWTLDVDVDKVALTLEEVQYRNFLHLCSCIANFGATGPHQRLRPARDVVDDPIAWWQYSYQAVCLDIQKKRKKWSWPAMYAALQ